MKFQCKWKKYLLLGIAILLVFIFSALIVLKTNYTHNFILGIINKSIPGNIFVEKFSFSVLKGEFNLYNVLIKGTSNEKIITFKNFYIKFSWIDLFKSQVTFKNIKLEDPFINLFINKEKNLNLLSAFLEKKTDKVETVSKEDKRELPFNIIVKNLQIVNGKFLYEDISNGFISNIQNISLNANADILKKTGRALLGFSKGTIKSNGFSTKLDFLNIKCGLNDGKLSPLSIKGAADFFKIDINGTIDDIFNNPNLCIDITANLNLDKFHDNLTTPENFFSGETTLTVNLKGMLSNPDIKISMDYTGGILAGSKVDNINLDMELADRNLDISNIDIKAEDGILKLIGQFDLKTAFPKGFVDPLQNLEDISYNISLKGNNLRLTNMPIIKIDGERLNGAVNLNASVKGAGISPDYMLTSLTCGLEINDFDINALTAPIHIAFKAGVSIDKGLINVSKIEMLAEDTTMHVKGAFHTKTKDFHAKLDLFAPNVEKPLTSFGIDNLFGKLLIDADISKKKENIDGSISVSGENLLISDICLGDINIDVEMKDDRLIIDQIHLRNKESEFFMDGFLTLFKPKTLNLIENPAFNLKIKEEKLYIKNFIDKYDGIISLSGNIKGTKNSLKGDLNLDIADLFLEGQKIKQINLPLSFSNKKVSLNPFKIEIQKKELLTGSGFVSFDKNYEIKLVSEGISFDSIAEIKKQGFVKGLLKLNLSGKGTFDNPQLEGKIDLEQLFISEKPFDDFHIDLKLEDQQVKVSGKLNFDINGSYHLRNKNFEASVLLNNTSFEPYFKIVNLACLNGNITGEIKANGNLGELNKTEGDVRITDFNLEFKNKAILNSQKIIANLKSENVIIPEISFKLLDEGSLYVSGKGDIKGTVDFNGKGNIPLHIVSFFVEDLDDIKGSLEFDTGIKGSFKKLDFKGHINLSDIQFTIPEIYQKVHKLNGQIDITSEKIQISSFNGFLDSGTFNIEGQIDHDNLLPIAADVVFTTHSLPIKIPDMLDMVINSKIKLSGTDKASLVEGEIVLLEGTYYKDIDLSPFKMAMENSLTTRRSEAVLEKEINQPFLKNMEFDIAILRRNPFIVENNSAFMEVNPDLHLTGFLSNPVINGRINIMNGEIYYQKRKFVINKGVIDFINPYKIEPEIDIESHAEIRDWVINLNVSGTPDKLLFEMKSNPEEEENDILSLILFGKTNRELVKGEGGSNLSTTQMIAEMVGSTFGDDIKKTTGLDIFEVDVNGSSEDSTSDNIKITMGKEITRRLTIKYELKYDEGENIQKGISEYRFKENFYLDGYQDTIGDFGFQMLFKLEYR